MRSEIVLDARRYLVWDDGLLWPKNNDVSALTERQAWEGSAWCRQTFANQYGQYGFNQLLVDEYNEKINQEAAALNKRRRLQLKLGERQNRELILDVAKRLCLYIPCYKNQSGHDEFYPLDFQRGYVNPLYGPMPWLGLLDKRLSTLEKDMILEGWLTIWKNPNSQTYTVQPASLLLLYWAARTLGILKDLDATHFIKNHCWNGWFGGRGVASS
jgi:hypothetical protein